MFRTQFSATLLWMLLLHMVHYSTVRMCPIYMYNAHSPKRWGPPSPPPPPAVLSLFQTRCTQPIHHTTQIMNKHGGKKPHDPWGPCHRPRLLFRLWMGHNSGEWQRGVSHLAFFSHTGPSPFQCPPSPNHFSATPPPHIQCSPPSPMPARLTSIKYFHLPSSARPFLLVLPPLNPVVPPPIHCSSLLF